MDLQNAMVSFELPEGGDFTRAFEATKECFQNEWRAFWEGRSVPFKRCEAARLQIHEERQRMRAYCAAADGENSGLRQRICQLREEDQQMLEHAKGLQDADEVLAAEVVFRKLGESNGHGNARCERAKERAQHPVATAAGRNGFSRAHGRGTAATAGK
ncbi:hypothetical protein ERJ75_000045800 [Trypanosoma vivax]|nr:hypothetical protein ERJ75_000045800 [Trypanosoma vivax]